jgi:hypothetical protein
MGASARHKVGNGVAIDSPVGGRGRLAEAVEADLRLGVLTRSASSGRTLAEEKGK